VIELSTEKHKNQFGGINPRPVFPVIGWVASQPQPIALPKRTTSEIVDDIIGKDGEISIVPRAPAGADENARGESHGSLQFQ
jgi:hypothetical protein